DVGRIPAKTPQADIKCKLACVDALQKIVQGVVALDDAGEILEKYRSKLNSSGTPGTGDAFLRHLSNYRGDPNRVKKIALTKDEDGNFVDFPVTADLKKFHQDDRIFVALACAAADDPIIFNAVDSDYKEHAEALTAVGVAVHEICPHCLK
ncbi:MAG TPA: hypothetical protein VH019_07550, partial [Rhizomicrobium sp.]|nr:hypothetical protein [Rhizomicrobium sp.]